MHFYGIYLGTFHILFHGLLRVGTEIKQWEVKKEPQSSFFGSHFEPSSSYSKTGLMSIALTLNQAAAEVGIIIFIMPAEV